MYHIKAALFCAYPEALAGIHGHSKSPFIFSDEMPEGYGEGACCVKDPHAAFFTQGEPFPVGGPIKQGRKRFSREV